MEKTFNPSAIHFQAHEDEVTCCSVNAAEQRRITAHQDAMDMRFGAMAKGRS